MSSNFFGLHFFFLVPKWRGEKVKSAPDRQDRQTGHNQNQPVSFRESRKKGKVLSREMGGKRRKKVFRKSHSVEEIASLTLIRP